MRGNEWEVAAEPCSTGCERMKSPCGPDFTDAWRASILHCITCVIMCVSSNTQNPSIRNAYLTRIVFLDLRLIHASYLYQSFSAIQISMLLKVRPKSLMLLKASQTRISQHTITIGMTSSDFAPVGIRLRTCRKEFEAFITRCVFRSISWRDCFHWKDHRAQQFVNSLSLLPWTKLNHRRHDIARSCSELRTSGVSGDKGFSLLSEVVKLTLVTDEFINLHDVWYWMVFKPASSSKDQYSSEPARHPERSVVSGRSRQSAQRASYSNSKPWTGRVCRICRVVETSRSQSSETAWHSTSDFRSGKKGARSHDSIAATRIGPLWSDREMPWAWTDYRSDIGWHSQQAWAFERRRFEHWSSEQYRSWYSFPRMKEYKVRSEKSAERATAHDQRAAAQATRSW